MRKTLAQIERALRDDIRWTIMEGPGWDPHLGCPSKTVDGNIVGFRTDCHGVCALGAFCARRQPKVPESIHASNIAAAAAFFGKDEDWFSILYDAVSVVASTPEEAVSDLLKSRRGSRRSAYVMADRLVRYARGVEKRKAASTLQTLAAS